MALNWHGLGFLFTAKDLASAVVQRIERSFGPLGDAAMKAGKAMAGAFVSYQAFQGGVAAMKGMYTLAEEAGRFEQKLAQLKVAASGAGANFIELARHQAMVAGLSSRSTPTEAIEGMRELAKAGMNAKDVLGMVNYALKLTNATAGEMKVKEAAEFIAQARASFARTGAPSAELIVNVAAKVAGESIADIKDVPGMFARVTRGSFPMQQKFTDTAALLAQIRTMGVARETAGTSLGMVMQALGTSSGMEKFAKGTGVAVKDAAGNFKPLMVLLAEMYESPIFRDKMASGEGNEFIKKMFGSRQVTTVEAALEKIRIGTENVNGQVLKGVAGAKEFLRQFEKAAKQNLIDQYELADIKSVGGILDWIGAKWATLRLQVGEMFLPVLRVFALTINKVLGSFGKLILAMPMALKTGIGLFMFLGVAAVTAVAAVLTLAFAFMALKAILLPIGAMLFMWLLKPMLIIGGILGVLTLMAFGFYAAWKTNAAGIRDILAGPYGFIEKIKFGMEALGQLFKEGGIHGDVRKFLNAPGNQGLKDAIMTVWMWISRIKNFGKGIWAGFQETMKGSEYVVRLLVGAVSELLEVFGVSVGKASDNSRAFHSWAQTGRTLGSALAFAANAGVLILTGAIELATVSMKGFMFMWRILGPSVTSALRGVIYALGAFGDLLAGNWDRMFRRLARSALNFVRMFSFVPGLRAHRDMAEQGLAFLDHHDELDRKRALVEEMKSYPVAPGTSPVGPMPAKEALLSQLRGLGQPVAAPAVNFNPVNHTVVNLGERTLVEAFVEHLRSSDNRSFMTVGPVNALER